MRDHDLRTVQILCAGDEHLCLFSTESITTAIALGMTEEMGGVAAVTVMSVFLTGILGAVIAGTVFKLFHIEDPVAQGLAMGTASHAIGTSKALEMGEIQAAMSSLAIAVTGIFLPLSSDRSLQVCIRKQ